MFNNTYGRGQITKCMTKDIIGYALLGDVIISKRDLRKLVRLYWYNNKSSNCEAGGLSYGLRLKVQGLAHRKAAELQFKVMSILAMILVASRHS